MLQHGAGREAALLGEGVECGGYTQLFHISHSRELLTETFQCLVPRPTDTGRQNNKHPLLCSFMNNNDDVFKTHYAGAWP